MRLASVLFFLQPVSLAASVILNFAAIPNYTPPNPPMTVYTSQIVIGTTAIAPVGLSPNTSAAANAAANYGVLIGAPGIKNFPYPNMTVSNPIPTAATAITIGGLPAGTTATFKPGKTGQLPVTLTAPKGDPDGAIGFENIAFAPVNATGGPSLFTAGIITDAGELSFTLTVSSLPNNLMGSTIVQTFFNDLNPVIGGYGAQILDFTPGGRCSKYSVRFFEDPIGWSCLRNLRSERRRIWIVNGHHRTGAWFCLARFKRFNGVVLRPEGYKIERIATHEVSVTAGSPIVSLSFALAASAVWHGG
jgi:hypothetical protein